MSEQKKRSAREVKLEEMLNKISGHIAGIQSAQDTLKKLKEDAFDEGHRILGDLHEMKVSREDREKFLKELEVLAGMWK